jgi:copper chaperone
MISFQVNDMTCGHCVSTITKAVKAADKDAKVTIDLSRHLVMVEPVEADAQELSDAIAEAGYAPALVPVATAGVSAPAVKARSCCGSCH